MTKANRLNKFRCLLITTGVGLGTWAGCGDGRSVDCDDGPGCETGASGLGSSTGTSTSTEGSTSTSTEGSGDNRGDGDSETGSGQDSTTESGGGTDEGGPLCGNGMIDVGEACDDGNSMGGDTCLADCQRPGKSLDEKIFGFDTEGTGTNDAAREVVYVTETSAHVLWQQGPQWRVVEIGTESLTVSAEHTQLEDGHRLAVENLAWAPGKTSMLGGYDESGGNKGLVQFFKSDGSLGTTIIYEPESGDVAGVRFRAATPDLLGNVIVAGSYGGGGIVARIAIPENEFVKWELAASDEIDFGPITVGSDDVIRAWEKGGALWFINQSDGSVIGTTFIPAIEGLTESSIILSMSSDNDLYIFVSHQSERRIAKVDEHGNPLWSNTWTDELDSFAGAATLPSDGIIVAGQKGDHGALLWVSSDGDTWFAANDLTPQDSEADSAKLDDVAISPSGTQGIAVGSVKLADSPNSDLWIRKIEI